MTGFLTTSTWYKKMTYDFEADHNTVAGAVGTTCKIKGKVVPCLYITELGSAFDTSRKIQFAVSVSLKEINTALAKNVKHNDLSTWSEIVGQDVEILGRKLKVLDVVVTRDGTATMELGHD